ncbi:MAG: septum formation initiator precursor [Alphaproteobacteria bacterium HGW-Alphaproteobacteria-4]|nr:MAG: septum formation initiator precursor [Alphaproteobacteria bacterium HGW-Alphaproteobacteria-4]
MARTRPGFGPLLLIMAALVAGGYFAFAAMQGSFGMLRRVQVDAEIVALTAERDALSAEAVRMANLTRRLSDSYLDLDLLDERARDVLGYLRADEVLIR